MPAFHFGVQAFFYVDHFYIGSFICFQEPGILPAYQMPAEYPAYF